MKRKISIHQQLDKQVGFAGAAARAAGSDHYSMIASEGRKSQHLAQLKRIANGAAAPVQLRANETGLPDKLKAGVEGLSGLPMDDVRVHYNSSKPAQLQAHAFAEGTDIHLAAGQEHHLPHEAWHVVQQKEGRVKPTLQLKGVAINDDLALEREADVMGAKANAGGNIGPVVQQQRAHGPMPIAQLRVVQRCKTAEEVLGSTDGTSGGNKKAFVDYLDELNTSLMNFLERRGDDLSPPDAKKLSDLMKAVPKFTDDLEAIDDEKFDPSTYADVLDHYTDLYRELKGGGGKGKGAQAAAGKGAKGKAKKVEADEVDDEEKGVAGGFDVPLVQKKALRLKGNDRPIKASTLAMITNAGREIVGLKQVLLDETRTLDASARITILYLQVKDYVCEVAQQRNDAEIREYHTMKYGGLVNILHEIENRFIQDDQPCNEEVGNLFLKFVRENRFERF